MSGDINNQERRVGNHELRGILENHGSGVILLLNGFNATLRAVQLTQERQTVVQEQMQKTQERQEVTLDKLATVVSGLAVTNQKLDHLESALEEDKAMLCKRLYTIESAQVKTVERIDELAVNASRTSTRLDELADDVTTLTGGVKVLTSENSVTREERAWQKAAIAVGTTAVKVVAAVVMAIAGAVAWFNDVFHFVGK